MYASECRSRCVLGGTETNIGEGGRGCGGGAMCWAPAKRKEKKKKLNQIGSNLHVSKGPKQVPHSTLLSQQGEAKTDADDILQIR